MIDHFGFLAPNMIMAHGLRARTESDGRFSARVLVDKLRGNPIGWEMRSHGP